MRAPLVGEPMLDKLEHRYFQIQPGSNWGKNKGAPIAVSILGIVETYADPNAEEPSYWDVNIHYAGSQEANIAVCADKEGATSMANLVADLLNVQVGDYWELRER